MKWEVPEDHLRVRVYVHTLASPPRVYYLDVPARRVESNARNEIRTVTIGQHTCSALKLLEYDLRIVLIRPIFLSGVSYREFEISLNRLAIHWMVVPQDHNSGNAFSDSPAYEDAQDDRLQPGPRIAATDHGGFRHRHCGAQPLRGERG